MSTVEEFVRHYGEDNRPLIEDSLRWLEDSEREWGTQGEFDREKFVSRLVGKRAEAKQPAAAASPKSPALPAKA